MNTTIDNSLALTKASRATITPAAAIQLLKEGNARFVSKNALQRNYLQHVEQTAEGQFPFAAVLGCIDSRVPSELVFDQGIGDIFNIRIAGNFVNEDILGSLEFACKVAGSKAILVLGHSECGAIKGACDNVELGNLTGMLDKIKPAVAAITDVEGERSSKNADFVQKVVDMNVKLTVAKIKEKSPILNEMQLAGDIIIAGAIYNVHTGKVDIIDL